MSYLNSPESEIMVSVYELEGYAERYNWVGVKHRAERILEMIAALPGQSSDTEPAPAVVDVTG